jgi:DNA-directed RNA polymerase specialized sigma24 family protein
MVLNHNSSPDSSNSMDSTDNHLIQRAQVNSQESWRVLVESYTPLVYQMVRKSGLQPTDAADVTQNVLLELTKSLGEFNRQNRGSFRKWLKIVTTNKVKDFFRKQQSVGKSDKLHAALIRSLGRAIFLQ